MVFHNVFALFHAVRLCHYSEWESRKDSPRTCSLSQVKTDRQAGDGSSFLGGGESGGGGGEDLR